MSDKRTYGSGSITRRSNSWRIKYYGDDPETGKRRAFTKTVHGSEADAKRKLRECIGEIEKGTHIAPSAETVADFARSWLENFKANPKKGKKTAERYGELIEKHIIPGIGQHKLGKLKAEHIEAFYRDKRSTSGRIDGRGGLSERTLLHIHRRLVEILESARRKKKVPANVALDIDSASKPSPEKPRLEEGIDFLNDTDMNRLLTLLQGTRIYTPSLLAATTGMRRGEVLGLRWSDLDLDRREDGKPAPVLNVAQALEQTADGITFKKPKSDSSKRIITLPDITAEALKQHKVEQAKERLALGLGKSNTDLVFTRYDGSIINPRNFSKEFQRKAAAEGFPKFTFHKWRHSHATALLNADTNVKVVSARLGHSTIAITLDIYGHVLERQEADVANKLETIFGAKS